MIIGVDPGQTGGLAVRSAGRLVHAQRMPTYKRVVSGNERPTVDAYGVLDFFRLWRDLGAHTAIIELVSGVKGQSAAGAFTFGEGVGVVVTAAASCGYAIERIPSTVWKNFLKVPRDKGDSVRRASELCPEGRHFWPAKADDGIAEAALIALYAERKLS